jgi:hypothetical protein
MTLNPLSPPTAVSLLINSSSSYNSRLILCRANTADIMEEARWSLLVGFYCV